MQHPTTTTGIKIGATSQLVMIQKVREAAAEQVIGAQSGWASAFWLIVGFFMFYFGSLSVWFLTPDGSIPALGVIRSSHETVPPKVIQHACKSDPVSVASSSHRHSPGCPDRRLRISDVASEADRRAIVSDRGTFIFSGGGCVFILEEVSAE